MTGPNKENQITVALRHLAPDKNMINKINLKCLDDTQERKKINLKHVFQWEL